MSDQKLKS